ncbi:hypothetical protein RPSD_51920 (plasmid) [Ralstonia solanacearum]|nr:hypothetical protein RPSD_51920 [Ralstonia solanacearum]
MTQPDASLASEEGALNGDSKAQNDPVLATNKPKLLDALRRAGAARAVVSYSGEGDSGNASTVEIYDADGKEIGPRHPVEVAETRSAYVAGEWQIRAEYVVMPLPDALCAYVDHALDLLHSGFQFGGHAGQRAPVRGPVPVPGGGGGTVPDPRRCAAGLDVAGVPRAVRVRRAVCP